MKNGEDVLTALEVRMDHTCGYKHGLSRLQTDNIQQVQTETAGVVRKLLVQLQKHPTILSICVLTTLV